MYVLWDTASLQDPAPRAWLTGPCRRRWKCKWNESRSCLFLPALKQVYTFKCVCICIFSNTEIANNWLEGFLSVRYGMAGMRGHFFSSSTCSVFLCSFGPGKNSIADRRCVSGGRSKLIQLACTDGLPSSKTEHSESPSNTLDITVQRMSPLLTPHGTDSHADRKLCEVCLVKKVGA